MKIPLSLLGMEPSVPKETAPLRPPFTPWCDLKSVKQGENSTLALN